MVENCDGKVGAHQGSAIMSESSRTRLSQRDRLDGFISLAEFRQGRKRERTTYEWRLTLALWVFIVGATYYVRPRPNEIILVLVLALVFLMHVFFVLEIRTRDRLDTEMAFFNVRNAEKLLKLAATEPMVRPTYKRSVPAWHWKTWWRLHSATFVEDIWWTGLEIRITAGLAIISFLLMGRLPA